MTSTKILSTLQPPKDSESLLLSQTWGSSTAHGSGASRENRKLREPRTRDDHWPSETLGREVAAAQGTEWVWRASLGLQGPLEEQAGGGACRAHNGVRRATVQENPCVTLQVHISGTKPITTEAAQGGDDQSRASLYSPHKVLTHPLSIHGTTHIRCGHTGR